MSSIHLATHCCGYSRAQAQILSRTRGVKAGIRQVRQLTSVSVVPLTCNVGLALLVVSSPDTQQVGQVNQGGAGPCSNPRSMKKMHHTKRARCTHSHDTPHFRAVYRMLRRTTSGPYIRTYVAWAHAILLYRDEDLDHPPPPSAHS